MTEEKDFLWWEGLEVEPAVFWYRKLQEKEIPADFQVLHRGFDAITGLGPYPTLYRVVISESHRPLALLAMSQFIVWPEAEDAVFQLSPLGLWAWKEGWIQVNGFTQTLATALWHRVYGQQVVKEKRI